jgi:hypothetical protein
MQSQLFLLNAICKDSLYRIKTVSLFPFPTQIERLAAVIQAVDNDTAVAPAGAIVLDARSELVYNKLFAGKGDWAETLRLQLDQTCLLFA